MSYPDKEAGLTVAIQAGGRSTRMGVDKSFVPFKGRAMIEIVKQQAAGLGNETILICNNQEPYAYLDLPMYADIFPDSGPLGGIYTALYCARYDHILTVACDMPWLNRSLLSHLIALKDTADVIVPRWDRFPEPLHAVYATQCTEPIAERLRAGKFKITGFFPDVRVRFVDREEIARFDPQGRSFTNVNAPEDLL